MRYAAVGELAIYTMLRLPWSIMANGGLRASEVWRTRSACDTADS